VHKTEVPKKNDRGRGGSYFGEKELLHATVIPKPEETPNKKGQGSSGKDAW